MNTEPTAMRLQAGMASARRLYAFAAFLLVVAHLGSGITIVAPNEAAVVLRFGRLHRSGDDVIVHPPGLLLAWPEPIDRVIRLPLKQEQVVTIGHFWPQSLNDQETSLTGAQYVLTGDHNLLRLQVVAKYRIVEPGAYVTTCRDPERLITICINAAVTAVLQESSIEESLRLRRETGDNGASELVSDLIRERAQRQLSSCACGLQLTTIEIKQSLPPVETVAEFEAVQTARIEQETLLEEMRGEHDQTLIEAEAESQQLMAEAMGSLQWRIAEAHSQAVYFQADLEMYVKSPEATIQRLHREAWQQILAQSRRVYFAPEQSHGSILRIPVASAEVTR